VIGGSVASSSIGIPRATLDTDILVELDPINWLGWPRNLVISGTWMWSSLEVRLSTAAPLKTENSALLARRPLRQHVDIPEVLGPTGCKLVPKKRIAPNEGNRAPIYGARSPANPRLFKRDRGNRGYQVNAVRLRSELNNLVEAAEVFRNEVQAKKAELHKGLYQQFSVCPIGPDKKIDVSGESGVTVPGNGKAADN
jgi:hypothetical protein